MNYFIVYAHPEPASYNGGARDTAVTALKQAGHKVTVSDLYAMEFDPRGDQRDFVARKDSSFFKYQLEQRHASEHQLFTGDIVAEQQKLLWCDYLILQFPLWWFSLPGILKGWVDRVFAMGFSYGGGMWYDKGKFVGKRAMLAFTTGGPQHVYTEAGINGDIDSLLYHVNHGMLAFTGFTVVRPFVAWSVARMEGEQRKQSIAAYVDRLLSIDEAEIYSFPQLEDYDEKLQKKERP